MPKLENKTTLVNLLWPWLIILPSTFFALSIFLIFWTETSQLLESVQIGNGLDVNSAYILFVPMLLLALTNSLFLSFQTQQNNVFFLSFISTIPWMVFLFFWIRINNTTVFLGVFQIVLFMTILGLILRTCLQNRKHWLMLSFTAVFIGYASCIFGISIEPIHFPRSLGAIVLIIAGLGFISFALMALFFDKRLTLALALIAGLSLAFDNPQHELRSVDAGKYVDFSIQQSFRQWITTRADLNVYKKANRPYPVIITSAEGGGITAGAHAYLTLMALQDNCPMFAQHIFASVGVSGGSFGNALFGSRTREIPNKVKVEGCRPSTKKPDRSGIDQNHFAPVIAAFLFSDIPNALIPGTPFHPTRATALELSFEELKYADKKFMQTAIEDSWEPTQNSPAMVFVTTEVSTGKRFQIAPFHDGPSWFLPSKKSISVSSAVSASARFPWITPSAAVVDGENSKNLVDGGYFENTGADAAMEIIRALWSSGESSGECGALPADCEVWKLYSEPGDCKIFAQRSFSSNIEWGCNIPIHVTYLAIADSTTWAPEFISDSGPQSFLIDPLTAMLKTRSARGTLALGNAQHSFCERSLCSTGSGLDAGFHIATLPSEKLNLPLGWSLSPKSVKTLENFSQSMDYCLALRQKFHDLNQKELDDFRQLSRPNSLSIKHYNGCHLATISSLFNLNSSDFDYYGIKGHRYDFQLAIDVPLPSSSSFEEGILDK